ncbi:hypothetical protein GE061_020224 [Apolygus lucorum]|uniref:Uncharacterized protein n=1 Tax=Apolygus lucorum TaxID=248454 RepID=A0A8S9WJX2_APOLU|nr:hypothetical protein GE061_020224 [Apolygus lucorum]
MNIMEDWKVRQSSVADNSFTNDVQVLRSHLRTGGRGLERTISVMSWDNQPALRRLGSALSGDAPSGLPSVELTLLVQLSTSWKLNSRLTSST